MQHQDIALRLAEKALHAIAATAPLPPPAVQHPGLDQLLGAVDRLVSLHFPRRSPLAAAVADLTTGTAAAPGMKRREPGLVRCAGALLREETV